MEDCIEKMCQEVTDYNANLPKEFSAMSMTNLIKHKDFPDLDIQITVGYNLQNEGE